MGCIFFNLTAARAVRAAVFEATYLSSSSVFFDGTSAVLRRFKDSSDGPDKISSIYSNGSSESGGGDGVVVASKSEKSTNNFYPCMFMILFKMGHLISNF